MSSIFLDHFLPYLLRQGLSLILLDLPVCSRERSLTPPLTLIPATQHWGDIHAHSHQAFLWVPVIQTQVLVT